MAEEEGKEKKTGNVCEGREKRGEEEWIRVVASANCFI
jgi:hypothetical protein